MDIVLPIEAEAEVILNALQDCTAEDTVCCQDENSFKLAKVLLIKEKIKDVTVQLLDDDGYAVKQITSKPRDKSKNRDQLNTRQITVIKALEKVLLHCKKEGVQLIGYSDELVALPDHIPTEELSSAGALDVNTHGVYKGADAVIPE